jgi:hypothetical protein
MRNRCQRRTSIGWYWLVNQAPAPLLREPATAESSTLMNRGFLFLFPFPEAGPNMQDEHLPRHTREQLEDELRERVLAARKAHRAAADNYLKVLDQYRDMLDHPDGARALHEAAEADRVAAENYEKVLRDFSELTVYGRHQVVCRDLWRHADTRSIKRGLPADAHCEIG